MPSVLGCAHPMPVYSVSSLDATRTWNRKNSGFLPNLNQVLMDPTTVTLTLSLLTLNLYPVLSNRNLNVSLFDLKVLSDSERLLLAPHLLNMAGVARRRRSAASPLSAHSYLVLLSEFMMVFQLTVMACSVTMATTKKPH